MLIILIFWACYLLIFSPSYSSFATGKTTMSMEWRLDDSCWMTLSRLFFGWSCSITCSIQVHASSNASMQSLRKDIQRYFYWLYHFSVSSYFTLTALYETLYMKQITVNIRIGTVCELCIFTVVNDFRSFVDMKCALLPNPGNKICKGSEGTITVNGTASPSLHLP